MKRRKVKKEKMIFSPKKIRRELQKMGESYSKKEAGIFYLTVLAVVVALGLLFHLRWYFLLISLAGAIVVLPKLMYNRKRQRYERRRFEDVNSYMAQMAQSFTSTKNMQASLRETMQTFSAGRMKDTIGTALAQLSMAQSNFRASEREALDVIEKNYDCKKIRQLHEFLLKAELRGGECSAEFGLLEQMRGIWEKAVWDYQSSMSMARNLAGVESLVLLVICGFMLEQFPPNLSVTNMTLIQAMNTILIVGFLFLFCHMDSRLNKSLLKDPDVMTLEKAGQIYEYLGSFSAKKARKKNLWLIILAGVLGAALLILKPAVGTLILAAIVFLAVYHMHSLIYILTMSNLKSEIRYAFPQWLFDLLLLMQSESVEVAIFKSIDTAPPVLIPELERLKRELEWHPANADSYMSFLAQYQIPGVEPSMRKLYSYCVGTQGKGEVMNVMVSSSMQLLTESEKQNIKRRGDLTKLYVFIPMVPVILTMFVYCLSLMVVIFRTIINML